MYHFLFCVKQIRLVIINIKTENQSLLENLISVYNDYLKKLFQGLVTSLLYQKKLIGKPISNSETTLKGVSYSTQLNGVVDRIFID